MIRAVLIDLDGTLVDTLGEIAIAANAMLVEAGRKPVADSVVAEAIGEGSAMLVERLIGRDQAEEWLPVYMKHYRVHNGANAQLFVNVKAGLDAMRAMDLALACVTNKPSELVLPLLDGLGIGSHFAAVIGGGDTVEKKPHPAPLFTACARMKVAPDACVMIGDSRNDALAARAAGIVSLTVPYGYPGASGDEGRAEALLAAGITCAVVPDLLAAAHWIVLRNQQSPSRPGMSDEIRGGHDALPDHG